MNLNNVEAGAELLMADFYDHDGLKLKFSVFCGHHEYIYLHRSVGDAGVFEGW